MNKQAKNLVAASTVLLGLVLPILTTNAFAQEYFSFSTPDHATLTETATAFPTAPCNGCHAAAAEDDFVFTQYYPVLRAGKAAGEEATGGQRSDLTPRN
jgi:hypothetical protein